MNVSFEEKNVWIQFISMVITFAAYLAVAGYMISAGVEHLQPYAAVFAVSVVAMVIIMVLGYIIAAITGRVEKRDERDRIIGWRAQSNSAWMLAAGIFTALCLMLASVKPLWVAHLLLISLYASQLMEYAFQLLYYRKGM